MNFYKVVFIFLFFSCTQNKLFTVEKNGGSQPFEKSYKIKLSHDTLFLNARSNFKLEGEFFKVLDKKEYKNTLENIDNMNLGDIKNSNNGSNLIFYYKDKKEEVKVNLNGFIPKDCKLFIRELEQFIDNSTWNKKD